MSRKKKATVEKSYTAGKERASAHFQVMFAASFCFFFVAPSWTRRFLASFVVCIRSSV
jgi:hypothetical protein